jgi:transposase
MSGQSAPKKGSKIPEKTRIRVAKQVVDGHVSAAEAAEALGVTRQAVSGWAKRLREKGVEDLLDKPVPGRPQKLSAGHAADLRARIIDHSPRDWGFDAALWNRKIARQLILREYGIDLSVQSIGYLLRSMGLSVQRPKYRAYEQDPDAVRQWKEETFPQIAEQTKEAGAMLMFGDEASVRSDYHAGGTWGLVGQTPVVERTGSRFTINMISAVGPEGDIHFSLIEGSCNSEAFIEYCRNLLADMKRPIFRIVDGASCHDSAATREFVASTEGRLRLFKLPGYSPELNPDERVWRNLKTHTVAKAGVRTRDEMKAILYKAAGRLSDCPAIVRGFFKDPSVAYISSTL